MFLVRSGLDAELVTATGRGADDPVSPRSMLRIAVSEGKLPLRQSYSIPDANLDDWAARVRNAPTQTDTRIPLLRRWSGADDWA